MSHSAATAKTFGCMRDHDREDSDKCFNMYTRFVADGVNCRVTGAYKNASVYSNFVADCGFLLVHRESHDNSILLSIYKHDATNDSACPELKIPIGLIAAIKYSEVVSSHGRIVKGQIDLTTHCTVDARILPGSMFITIHMDTTAMYHLQNALHIASNLLVATA